jgi:dolichol-phosphate mannosyltransferase
MRLEEEPLLSIIVPAYNEAENIARLLERVHRALQGINYEIVIVDDGSFDGTSEAALASARSLGAPLVLIRLERNREGISLSSAPISSNIQRSCPRCSIMLWILLSLS